ncbi:MAG: NFACT family protein [Spirochaeta sp.]|jgi:predicted ribosome quality control (RQC) complex YloA/Tae2 family protein|nr:NFACT family protein [Spirochaeta sp.]
MSLNSPEIDAILTELPLTGSHIQKIIQPDFKNLYLQIYSNPEAWWLRICLEHPRVRLHRTDYPVRAKRSHQRFEDFLHARINGGRIDNVEHVYQDRIVRLDVRRDDRASHLYIRLWGTRANVIATDPDGTILDVCFRKPREGLETGGSFHPHPPERDNSGRTVRPRTIEGSFNHEIDETYRQQERERDQTQLVTRVRTALERTRRRLSARLAEIENGQRNADEGERNRHYGDLILASIARIHPGDEWVETEDYLDGNRPVRIQLDPRLDGAANAQTYYDRARRSDESSAFLDSSAEALTARLAEIDRRMGQLESLDLPDLRALAEETIQDRRGGADTRDTPGIEFESGGFRIVVGRNARENDRLLRGRVRGNDWWLHTRDYAGGYVFIRARAGKSVPLEVLLDAGNLALFYSKGRANGKGDLYYTQVKYLRRAKDGPVGLVLPTQEKNLSVELDPERLRRLGIGSSI